MMPPPSQVALSGQVDHSHQSSPMPQAKAVYSKGATALACPRLNAEVMATCPKKPVVASASSKGASDAATGTQLGQANTPAPKPNISITDKIMLSLVSVRLSTRLAMADTA